MNLGENIINPHGYLGKYQIANDKANGNKFYMVKDITKTDPSPTGWNQHPGSRKSPNNVINNNQANFNPNTTPTLQKTPYDDFFEALKRKRRSR